MIVPIVLFEFFVLLDSQHLYKFYSKEINWNSAKSACESLNPPQQLAIIQTQAEWQQAVQAIKNVTASNSVMVCGV